MWRHDTETVLSVYMYLANNEPLTHFPSLGPTLLNNNLASAQDNDFLHSVPFGKGTDKMH